MRTLRGFYIGKDRIPQSFVQKQSVMTGLYKYFKRQSLPNNSSTGLGEPLTKEANAAVQHVIGGDYY